MLELNRRNRHGLSRDIPDPAKRRVRQACGFGCVICGASIVQYAHVDPEFPDARKHDPLRIALLCPQRHSKVTAGMWSKEKIKFAMSAPRCKDTGFSSEVFDLGQTHPVVTFGGVTLRNCEIPVQVRDLALFQVKIGEESRAPFRLTAHFFNSSGAPSLFVRENEWFAFTSNWDVEVSGGVITVRDSPGHISLKLLADPPQGLIVERMDMLLHGFRFVGGPNLLQVVTPSGGTTTLTSCLCDNCKVGLSLS